MKTIQQISLIAATACILTLSGCSTHHPNSYYRHDVDQFPIEYDFSTNNWYQEQLESDYFTHFQAEQKKAFQNDFRIPEIIFPELPAPPPTISKEDIDAIQQLHNSIHAGATIYKPQFDKNIPRLNPPIFNYPVGLNKLVIPDVEPYCPPINIPKFEKPINKFAMPDLKPGNLYEIPKFDKQMQLNGLTKPYFPPVKLNYLKPHRSLVNIPKYIKPMGLNNFSKPF